MVSSSKLRQVEIQVGLYKVNLNAIGTEYCYLKPDYSLVFAEVISASHNTYRNN